jgi:hypothetical protein
MPQLYPHLRNAPSFRQKQVRMGSTNFFPSVIRIKEGESITLFAEDTDTYYTIVSGTWENLKLRKRKDPGIPVIGERQVVDEILQIIIGPFNSVGRFEFCSAVQCGMNLTVHVSESDRV